MLSQQLRELEGIVAYDERLTHAAQSLGIRVIAPT
jgi:predicted DNA-binding protein (UPF0278 family)